MYQTHLGFLPLDCCCGNNCNLSLPQQGSLYGQYEHTKPKTLLPVGLLLKVSALRFNNFKPYLLGGISTALNLSSKQDNVNDNSLGEFRTKKNVLFYEIGFGIDLYLEWFKFSPSIRGVFAISDELVADDDPNSPWTGNIDIMKTSGIMINFTFQ